jgi:tetratricopeptide (TPR) repeat protein
MTKSLLGQELPVPAISAATAARLQANLATAEANFAADPTLENIIWYGRRLAYIFRYDESIQVFTDGLTRYPDSHELRRHRGHRYISTRQFDEAIADFEAAAALAANRPVAVEPDGTPNRLNQPVSNSHFNIWYHLGLSYYLTGQFAKAIDSYHTCMTYSDNDDSITATSDWLYMSLRRLNRPAEAAAVLEPIHSGMTIVESPSYLNRLLMYKGERTPESLLQPEEETPESTAIAVATQGYGVGNWYLYNGDEARAREIFNMVLATPQWSAFGYIAAEVDMVALGEG